MGEVGVVGVEGEGGVEGGVGEDLFLSKDEGLGFTLRGEAEGVRLMGGVFPLINVSERVLLGKKGKRKGEGERDG